MRTLSLLTAALPAKTQYLAETGESVANAKREAAGRGWSIRWIIVLDGPGDAPGAESADLVVRMPRQRGITAARNAALARADSEWVAPLDADDLVDGAGLSKLLEFIDTCSEEDLGWIGANRTLISGERTPHWKDAYSEFQKGTLSQRWTSPFPFHPNSVLLRRRHALSIGGWPGVPVNEDMGLMLLLSEHSKGVFLPEILTRYRTWPLQEVASDTYVGEKNMAFSTIEAIVNACRARQGRTPVAAPAPGRAFGIEAKPVVK